MAFGERLRFFRKFRNMTQKYLGVRMGFTPRTADVRMAQYESGVRKPKADLVERFAVALEISPSALDVPNIDTYQGLMHTLFAIEDIYGLKVDELDGCTCLRLDPHVKKSFNLSDDFEEWLKQRKRYEKEEITREQYDEWRYSFPEIEAKHYDSVREYYGIRKLSERGPDPFEGAEDIELDE